MGRKRQEPEDTQDQIGSVSRFPYFPHELWKRLQQNIALLTQLQDDALPDDVKTKLVQSIEKSTQYIVFRVPASGFNLRKKHDGVDPHSIFIRLTAALTEAISLQAFVHNQYASLVSPDRRNEVFPGLKPTTKMAIDNLVASVREVRKHLDPHGELAEAEPPTKTETGGSSKLSKADDGYVQAGQLWRGRFVSYDEFKRFLKRHPEIPWHQKAQRRMVHAAKCLKAMDAENVEAFERLDETNDSRPVVPENVTSDQFIEGATKLYEEVFKSKRKPKK